jgi:hypothetical protein
LSKVTQLAVTLANKPGTLAPLCSTLGKAGVNISALFAPEIRGRGKVRLLVDNLEQAKEALKAAKIRFSEEEAIAMELDNRANVGAEIAEKLSQAKINIKYAYATATEGAAKTSLILSVPNVAKALTVLGQ